MNGFERVSIDQFEAAIAASPSSEVFKKQIARFGLGLDDPEDIPCESFTEKFVHDYLDFCMTADPLAAFVTYIALHGFVFTFQSLSLIIEWISGSQQAFGPYPKASSSEVLSYGVVNLGIFAVGLGLVYLGHRLGARRRTRSGAPVALEPTR